MLVVQAIKTFETLAQVAGFSTASLGEWSDQAMESRIVRVIKDGAELRLAWDAKQQYLSLQISHGPPGLTSVGWLNLFRARVMDESVGLDEQSGEPFEQATEYGIELMSS